MLHCISVEFHRLFQSQMIVFILENIADPDEMLHTAAFHLSLHCFPKSLLNLRPKKKKRGLFLGPFFLKTDTAGRLFILIFIQQKTDVGTFLSRKYRKWSRE